MIDVRLFIVLSEAYRQQAMCGARSAFDWVEWAAAEVAAYPTGPAPASELLERSYRLAAAALNLIQALDPDGSWRPPADLGLKVPDM